MIKINISNINKLETDYFDGVESLVRLKLITPKSKRLFVTNNLKRIILAKNNEFECIIKETKNIDKRQLELAFIGSQKEEETKSGSSNGYKKFIIKSNKHYDAYNLAKELNLNVCPYCNRNYTFTIKSVTNKATRPEFDHFLCKKEHPIFALSLYNLIPSCHICNSVIKGQSQFNYNTHIHPYFDDFNKIKKFNTDKKLLSLITKKDEFNIVLKDRQNISKNDKLKADNHVKDFVLETLYNSHKDKVLELVDFSRAYNKDALDNIVNEFKESTKIFKDTNEIKRLLLGHHIENENIDKRPLNKLIKDISEELGLI